MPPSSFDRDVYLSYSGRDLETGSVVKTIERKLLPIKNPKWDLPDLGKSPVISKARIAVIRPVTVRKEWQNDARSPLPEYIAMIAADLKRRGFAVVVVAHLKTGEETLAGELPPHNAAFVNGEFDVRQLLALVRDAAVVIGGVGWIVPAAIALKARCFIVLGGQGGHNAPEKITDPRMDLSRIGFAIPENYCRCTDMAHECTKTIPDLMKHFNVWAIKSGLFCSKGSHIVA